MKRKLLSAILAVAMMATMLTGCGGGDAAASSSGDLIKVGIINNDPNESG